LTTNIQQEVGEEKEREFSLFQRRKKEGNRRRRQALNAAKKGEKTSVIYVLWGLRSYVDLPSGGRVESDSGGKRRGTAIEETPVERIRGALRLVRGKAPAPGGASTKKWGGILPDRKKRGKNLSHRTVS